MATDLLLEKQLDKVFNGHIVISDNRTKHVIAMQNILRLESKRVYTIIFVKNNTQYICSRNLKVVYEELQSGIFFRVHKSHVINLREVKAYCEGRGGQVIMSDNTIIDVAQRKKTAFLKSFYEVNAMRPGKNALINPHGALINSHV